jgi:hypothetical protein
LTAGLLAGFGQWRLDARLDRRGLTRRHVESCRPERDCHHLLSVVASQLQVNRVVVRAFVRQYDELAAWLVLHANHARLDAQGHRPVDLGHGHGHRQRLHRRESPRAVRPHLRRQTYRLRELVLGINRMSVLLSSSHAGASGISTT